VAGSMLLPFPSLEVMFLKVIRGRVFKVHMHDTGGIVIHVIFSPIVGPFVATNTLSGMSHAAILSRLKTGFHRMRIPWGHNADHQPVGGKFTSREHALTAGCVLASYAPQHTHLLLRRFLFYDFILKMRIFFIGACIAFCCVSTS
jgi:hypothetical protein